MLKDRNIVITGAAGALGQAVAECAQGQGAVVIGLDIAKGGDLPHTDRYVQADLRDWEATRKAIGGLGSINALLNIAGGFAMGAEAAEPTDEQWAQMFEINVATMRNATRAAVPGMLERGGGAIVNIGALGALAGTAHMSAYCCAKSCVMRLTESLSAELKHRGIRVNAVLPSIIDTPANRKAMPEADFGAWVKPEELAQVICFLASDAAKAVQGALIPTAGLN